MFLNFVNFMATKKARQLIFSALFVVVGIRDRDPRSEIRDPGYVIRDPGWKEF
jgi:hypothetical protein